VIQTRCDASLLRTANTIIVVGLVGGGSRMERIAERPGALDVHKASVTACVRVWEGRELTERIAEFATTVAGLLALADWLAALDVKQVVMEATGVCWKPVWAILEDGVDCMLVPRWEAAARWGGGGAKGRDRSHMCANQIRSHTGVSPVLRGFTTWQSIQPGDRVLRYEPIRTISKHSIPRSRRLSGFGTPASGAGRATSTARGRERPARGPPASRSDRRRREGHRPVLHARSDSRALLLADGARRATRRRPHGCCRI
jgi:hypothetical protein